MGPKATIVSKLFMDANLRSWKSSCPANSLSVIPGFINFKVLSRASFAILAAFLIAVISVLSLMLRTVSMIPLIVFSSSLIFFFNASNAFTDVEDSMATFFDLVFFISFAAACAIRPVRSIILQFEHSLAACSVYLLSVMR